MNFAIPRNNTSEMLLYIWKIIDLPYILYDDLVFRISFDLYLDPPEKAKIFINKIVIIARAGCKFNLGGISRKNEITSKFYDNSLEE